uniref:Uncharacterized protein n=1 Tax=Macaca fascicularis TaxID=9541 RepID=A0A7N9D5P3_MACFA
MCWKLNLGILSPLNYLQIMTLCVAHEKKSSTVHVHNVQVCYICIHVPCWCAAPINSSFPLKKSFTSL